MDLSLLSSENRQIFIEENKNFIYVTCFRVCKRHLSWENDDELSIGLITFNKACDNYKEDKGEFFSYAKVLIRNALIDFFRKSKNIPYLTFESEDDEKEYVEYKTSMDNYQIQVENSRRAEEILALSKELSKYGLDFNALIKVSPSHKDTRDSLLNLAFICMKEMNILDYIKEKKQLPIKEIMILGNVNRKFLDKWRKYLITLIIILSNDEYSYIRSYLNIKVGDKSEV